MEKKKKKKSTEKTVSQTVLKCYRELRKLKNLKPGRDYLTSMTDDAKKELAYMLEQFDLVKKKSPLIWLPATEKFFTTIGVEYTFMKPLEDKRTEDEIAKIMIEKSDKRQKWNTKFHPDGMEVIECASPAHKNWEELIQYYRATVKNAKSLGLVFKREDRGGGAGHIHLGLPRQWTTTFRLKFLKILFLDIAMRPYLNWIFNEPSDDKNANSMLISRSCIKFLKEANQKSYIDMGYLLDVGGKTYAVRYDDEYDTVEFRIFNMMENERMLEECIEFVNAYFRFIYNKARTDYYSGEYSGMSYYNVQNDALDKYKDKKYTIKEFNKLLDKLGLNKGRYKKYIKTNYEARLQLAEQGHIKMDYTILNGINLENNNDGDEKCYDRTIVTDSTYSGGGSNQILDLNGEAITNSSDGLHLEMILNESGEYQIVPMSAERVAQRAAENATENLSLSDRLRGLVNQNESEMRGILETGAERAQDNQAMTGWETCTLTGYNSDANQTNSFNPNEEMQTTESVQTPSETTEAQNENITINSSDVVFLETPTESDINRVSNLISGNP